MKQLGLTKGYLIRWTKGFNCEGVVDYDVVELLEEALRRRGVSNHRYFTHLNDLIMLSFCSFDVVFGHKVGCLI